VRRLAALVAALDEATDTQGRLAALVAHFRTAPEADRVWAVALLAGRRPRRTATHAQLRDWAAAAAAIPPWLFDEAHAVTGDLAETAALVLPPPGTVRDPGLAVWMERLVALAALGEAARRAAVLEAWAGLDTPGRIVLNRLVTGGFRPEVTRRQLAQALSLATGQDEAAVAAALAGEWDPARTPFAALVARPAGAGLAPLPFCPDRRLDGPPEALGDPALWLAERAWDGLRAQIIARDGALAIWAQAEGLVTDRFPEIAPLARALPQGCTLEGEVLAWAGAAPLPAAALRARLGRGRLTRRQLDAAPAVFIASDLLEAAGRDLRAAPFADRRTRLAALVAGLPAGGPLRLSLELPFADWAALYALRAGARAAGAVGLMLSRRAAPRGGDHDPSDRWRWPCAPMTVDAVMVYAHPGPGRAAAPFTGFTFALRDGEALVPVARAASGLTVAELADIAAFVRGNTLERFGPVRRLRPELVFEIAFEGIDASPRHKAGLALRHPRILRWRRDLPAAAAGTLGALREMLPPAAPG
jgi:DNA ligase-1